MNDTYPQCNPDRLRKAISESLDEVAESKLAEHLCDCERCREQLADFAGEATFWEKATSNLAAAENVETNTKSKFETSVFINVDPSARSHASVSYDNDQQVAADIPFDSPTHPEMLGRVDGFAIERVIGRGGMGIVYKGFDAELNRPVAIKFLAPHLSVSGVARKRFAREAQAAAAVVHPNVVPIYSIGTSRERPYLVMALVSGRSLQKHVEVQGPLPIEDVVRIAQQIAAGLSAAHEQGLIHRDIKPANIMLEKEVSRVLITDFGLARAVDDAGLTQSGWLAGTPHYMSPEQAKGDDVDHRSDLFSLGSAIYFMATGREPFRAENPYAILQKIGSKEATSMRSINSQVPSTLDDITFRLLSKDPADRFDSAASVQEVLTQYLAHLQNPTQNLKPKVNRTVGRTLLPQFFAGMVVTAIVLFLTLLWATQSFKQPATPGGFPEVTRHAAQPTFQPPIGSSPAWIAEQSSSRQWSMEMAELRRSVEQMEQLPYPSRKPIDRFEIEKSELNQRLEAFENSFGR